jgi:phospholipid/cholesterol/gamma-HCH transport system permease protein
VSRVESIGRGVLSAAENTWGSAGLLLRTIRRIVALADAPVRTVLYRQLYFTGVEAVGTVSFIGVLIGIVVITQVTYIVGHNALLIGRILIWTVVRELGPLLTAIIVIARSATAMATELGSMRVRREMDYLSSMGIDPGEYLIVPRVVGMTLCVFILNFYFQAMAIGGGLVVSSFFLADIPFLQQLREIFGSLGLFEVAVSLVKSLAFGLAISSVSCYHGLRVRTSITEIPQAATRAVMLSLFLVFVMDGVITLLAFV